MSCHAYQLIGQGWRGVAGAAGARTGFYGSAWVACDGSRLRLAALRGRRGPEWGAGLIALTWNRCGWLQGEGVSGSAGQERRGLPAHPGGVACTIVGRERMAALATGHMEKSLIFSSG